MSLKKRHENGDVLFLSWLKLLSVSNDFPSALRNWQIKERTLVPKNRTQELCKHSINFCGKLVFITINLHFFIFKTLRRKYCKRSNVFSFALFLSTDCDSYVIALFQKYSNLRPALYVFFPWNCTMLISHKMDTKSASWQLQRNKFTSRERGYSSNTSSWYDTPYSNSPSNKSNSRFSWPRE